MTDTKEIAVVKREIQKQMSAVEMEGQIRAYFEMQQVLDKALPDSIMEIQGRQFRKKSYWRAIAVAFGIELELVSEERFEIPGQWGHKALYRASLPSGKSMVGDGICTSQEKRGASCTEHNVRSHAHTRAKNRAIADLVGFGEVSAEEVERDDVQQAQTAPMQVRVAVTYKKATTPMWKKAQAKGMSPEDWKAMMKMMDVYPNDEADSAVLEKISAEVESMQVVDVPAPKTTVTLSMTKAECDAAAFAAGVLPSDYERMVAKHGSDLVALWDDIASRGVVR